MTVLTDVCTLIENSPDRPLTDQDAQEFLNSIATAVGGKPQMVYGGYTINTFRWILTGDRIAPSYDDATTTLDIAVNFSIRRGVSITVNQFYAQSLMNRLEYREFEYAEDMRALPYLWSVPLDEPLPGWWGFLPFEILTWQDFDEVIRNTFGNLPAALAVMPEAWRPEDVGMIWYVHGSPEYQALGIKATAGYVYVFAMLRQEEPQEVYWDFPRSMVEEGKINLTDAIAGLAGGGGLNLFGQLTAPGFSFCQWTPLAPQEGPHAFQPTHATPEPRPGLTDPELRKMLAEYKPEPPQQPKPITDEYAAEPLHAVMSPHNTAEFLLHCLSEGTDAIMQRYNAQAIGEKRFDQQAYVLSNGMVMKKSTHTTSVHLTDTERPADSTYVARYRDELITALTDMSNGSLVLRSIVTSLDQLVRKTVFEGPENSIEIKIVRGSVRAHIGELFLLMY